ncbi:MAG: glycosyltransferase family 4 protein [Actinomycetota bacterium]|nr:glycosyltransferase family 4 protein [Actinomycetota bacterium]
MIDNVGSGGAELLLAEFAHVAPAVGIELSVASLQPPLESLPAARRLRARGVEPAFVPVKSLLSPVDARRVRRHLADVRPDLLHTHLGSADYFGGLAARSLGIPQLATIHADWWPNDLRSRLKTYVMSRTRRHCASYVVAVSESARRAYLAAGRDRPEHVLTIHNGIPDRPRPGTGNAVRRELGLRADDLVATMVSKLRPEKNFEVAIDAVAHLRARFPTLRLVIAGDGPHEDTVRRHAAPLGETVVMAGHREDVMELLDASDVLLQPSRVDAFPTSVLEAMCACVPTVATATGGLLEMVSDGESGLLVRPPVAAESLASALTTLLEDPGRRSRLATAARRRYERDFTAERWAERVRALYDCVLDGPARRSPRYSGRLG